MNRLAGGARGWFRGEPPRSAWRCRSPAIAPVPAMRWPRCWTLTRKPGTSSILADNSGTVPETAGVAVVRATAERSPAHAATPAPSARATTGSCSWMPTAERPAASSTPTSARRSPTTWAPWRERWWPPPRTRWSAATARRGAFSASGRICSIRSARARWRRTCWCAAPPSPRSAASTRAFARPRTPTSAGACRRPGGAWSCAAPPPSSTATARASRSCAASGAGTPPGGHGWPAATTASSPSPPLAAPCAG